MLRSSRQGFTLIELLVVIAIIAILAAILFPIFTLAKGRGKQAQCAGNLKQIGLATSMYMSDNGSRFPVWRSTPGDVTGTWFVQVKKYSHTKLLARCPSDVPDQQDLANEKAGVALVSYWKNVYLDYWSGPGGFNPSAVPPTEGEVRFTRSTVYLMDGPLKGVGGHTWYGPPHSWDGTGMYSNYKKEADRAETRHGGSANVLFCDWHVKTATPSSFVSNYKNTPEGNPLSKYTTVPEPWCDRNDGGHPWFRPD